MARSMPFMQATSVALTGVGTPWRWPQRTTAPLMNSISVTEPFSRLCNMEVLNDAGRPWDARFQAASAWVRPKRTPAAVATAMASSTAARAVALSSGSL
ncbi:hypothetical protein D3C78_1489860 [compost metagenome]